MWEFLYGVAPLFIMIYKEYLSRAAKAETEKSAFELDQSTLKLIVDQAVNDWNALNSQKSSEARSAWDAADEDTNKKI